MTLRNGPNKGSTQTGFQRAMQKGTSGMMPGCSGSITQCVATIDAIDTTDAAGFDDQVTRPIIV